MPNSEQSTNNYRSAVLNDPYSSLPTSYSNEVFRTPYAGNVRSLGAQPPPLPQAPTQTALHASNNNYNSSYYSGAMNNGLYGGGYGGYGSSLGGYGGFGAYGGGAGMYNRFGSGAGYGIDGGINALDPEYRFIQLAEASSRPAFQSIESLVAAIGNIAAMLDSTFFALTSSFRAVLGVAANFGRLRGVFAQFWQTFALFRALKWLYKKILYWLKLSNIDPSKQNFNQIIADNLNNIQNGPPLPKKGQSPWPVLAFLSFIFTAPYLIMKLLGSVANTAREESRNPAKWVRPIETVALFDFYARNNGEISITAGQRVIVAPKEIQNSQMLLNTGWALATVDGSTSGLVPLNYVKSPQQMREENLKPPLQTANTDQQHNMHTMQIPIQHVGLDTIREELPEETQQLPPTADIYNTPLERNLYQNESVPVEENQVQSIIPENNIDLNSLSVSAFAPPPASTMMKAQRKLQNTTTASPDLSA